MSALVANQTFVTALVALMHSSAVLIAAAAAYLVVRTKLAKQGQKIDDLKEQVNAGGAQTASSPTIVTVPPAPISMPIAASVYCPHCGQEVPLDGLTAAPQHPATSG